VELPPLPLQKGGGAVFESAVREAFRAFVNARPDLQPLVVPLRITVLVVPPADRTGRAKDLDNILVSVLTALEAESLMVDGWRA
jgi:Holliday junction resolvase RusA-like endonuclease